MAIYLISNRLKPGVCSAADLDKFNQLFHFMLARGVYLPPSAFESYFLCQDFGNTEIEHIVKQMKEFLQGA